VYWEDLFEKACSLYWGAGISEGLEVKVYISSTLFSSYMPFCTCRSVRWIKKVDVLMGEGRQPIVSSGLRASCSEKPTVW